MASLRKGRSHIRMAADSKATEPGVKAVNGREEPKAAPSATRPTDPLRILMVHTRYRERGGEDAVVDALTADLRGLGHEVIAFELHNSTALLRAAGQLATSAYNVRSAARTREVIEGRRPDVAHVHNLWFGGSPSVLAQLRRLRVPTVATIHNYRTQCLNAQFLRNGRICTDCLNRTALPGVYHGCYRGSVPASAAAAMATRSPFSLTRTASRLDGVHFLNKFMRDLLAPPLGIDTSRSYVIGNYAREDRPQALSPRSMSTRFLFVGRLSPEKGVETLLAAWDMAQREPALRNCSLTIAGDGPLRNSVSDAASRVPNLHYVGNVDPQQRTDLMRSARALVIPSVWMEGQPLVMIEALSAGLPLICSQIGGFTELVSTHRVGLLFAAGEAPSLLRALVASVTDDDQVDAHALNAKETFLQDHTREAVLPRIVTMYHRAQQQPVAKGTCA